MGKLKASVCMKTSVKISQKYITTTDSKTKRNRRGRVVAAHELRGEPAAHLLQGTMPGLHAAYGPDAAAADFDRAGTSGR